MDRFQIWLREDLNQIYPDAYACLEHIDTFPPEAGLACLTRMVGIACGTTNEINRVRNKDAMRRCPREWIRKHLAEAIERDVNLDDYWDLGRLFELLAEFAPDMARGYADLALKSNDLDVLEVVHDWFARENIPLPDPPQPIPATRHERDTTNAHLPWLFRDLAAVNADIWVDFNDIHKRPKDEALVRLSKLVAYACGTLRDGLRYFNTTALKYCPPDWVREHLPEAIKRGVNLDDAFELTLLFELLETYAPESARGYAEDAITHPDPAVREAAGHWFQSRGLL